MKVWDGIIRDFEISNDSTISVSIYQVHQKELDNYYSNELNLPDDVLTTNNDIITPIDYT